MSKRQLPDIDYVRQCLRYEDGRLFWLRRPRQHFSRENSWKVWNVRFSGKEVGTRDKEGRIRTRINGRELFRHHIVFALHYGRWANEIDHKDRDLGNDKVDNLRESTHAQNCGNRSLNSNNRSGFKGVTRYKGKWWARISVLGKRISLGHFVDLGEAHEAYMKAAKHYWGEFATDGKRRE